GGGEVVAPGRGDLAEQLHRVASDALPQFLVDPGEHVAGLRVPGPAEVGDQLTQRSQRLRQCSSYGESPQCFHSEQPTGHEAVITARQAPTDGPGAAKIRHHAYESPLRVTARGART